MTGLRRARRDLHTNVQMRLVFVAQIGLVNYPRACNLSKQMVNSLLAYSLASGSCILSVSSGHV